MGAIRHARPATLRAMPPGISANGCGSALGLEQRGSGEPLVLLHGLATTRGIWRRALPRIGVGRRLVTLDVPGFGDSAPAGPGFDLDAVAALIAASLERAGVATP